jgi:cation transport ATPase
MKLYEKIKGSFGKKSANEEQMVVCFVVFGAIVMTILMLMMKFFEKIGVYNIWDWAVAIGCTVFLVWCGYVIWNEGKKALALFKDEKFGKGFF